MKPVIKNSLAVATGIVVGSAVNFGIIMVSGSIVPPPEGADVTTMEGLQASMHMFGPQHFIMPFLAHALGTFAGAFLSARIALSHNMKFALVIGFVFLAGGIINAVLLPSPLWFNVVDIAAAYLPIAYIAGKIAKPKF